jgi:hypothetical protein
MHPEKEQIEEALRAAVESARARYRQCLAGSHAPTPRSEASTRYREALERFHRFVLDGVIPEDCRPASPK